jgi:cytochrome c oxidase cbb3-type subunit III
MRAFALLFAALALMAQHQVDSDKKPRNAAIGDPVAIAAGASLYAGSCSGCHGPDGQGGRGPNLIDRVAWHPLNDDTIYSTIKNGVGGADMPPTNLPEEKLWELTAFVVSLTSPAIEANPPGDAKGGEEIFWGKGTCGNCHAIRGRGGRLGPDLSNVAAIRPLARIRESILDPDADGFRDYKGITVTLKDGRTVRGVARNRTNYSLQIQDAKGDLHLLSVSQVKDMKIDQHSPMPGDYGKRLSKPELENLLAYLSRQSMRPPFPEK